MPSSVEHRPLGLGPFALERFFAQYEFNENIKFLACCSDSEPMTLTELLELADVNSRQRWDCLTLSYTESQGLPELRREVAVRRFTSLSADDILIAAPQEAVFLGMHALLRPGDCVVCMHPAYQSLYDVANSIGAEILYWRPRQRDPHAELYFDIADLRSLITSQDKEVRLVVINAPHNPTGWLPSLTEFQEIVEICKGAAPGGAYLFSDEMYRGLELDPSERLPTGADAFPGRGISLGGLSKAVGLPGLRVGWLATSDRTLLRTAASLKDFTTICTAAPSEVLALAAVRAWNAIAARQLAIIRHNLEAMDVFASEWGPMVQWSRPKAGTVGYPLIALPQGCPGVDEFCRRLADEGGVLVLPGSVYNDPQADALPGKGRVRVGFGRKDYPKALQALSAAMRKLGLKSP